MSLYPMTNDQPSRLLCVFAHPDDEVFCVGETLARWVAAGGEAMVLSATRGEAGQIQDAHAASRQTLGAVRERELRDGCAELGVRQVECLDYVDGGLSEVGEMRLARDVAARIRDFQPDVVVTFGPDGGYGHPDHVTISAATTLACEMIARAGGKAPLLYYSAFPRQHRLLCHELAHWLTADDSHFRGSAAFVRALALLADEAMMLGYADDTVETQWFPAGFAMIEQGETANKLYLIISGRAEAIRGDNEGGLHAGQSLGPGHFFGERALASGQPQEASVVATETVTCLVFSAQAPTLSDGRGAGARLGGAPTSGEQTQVSEHTSRIGVSVPGSESVYLRRKVAALAAHRTQFAFEATMLPATLLRSLLGVEYFERVALSGQRASGEAQDWWNAQVYSVGQALRAS